MKKASVIIVIGILAAVSQVARAEPSAELSAQLDQQLTAMDQAIAGDQSSSPVIDETVSGSEEAWFLKNFWLRTRLQFGFAVPGLAKLVVVPEAEFLFTRDNPQGWTNYKP